MKPIPPDSPHLAAVESAAIDVIAAIRRLAREMSRCRSEHGWIPTQAATGLSRTSLDHWCDGRIAKHDRLAEMLAVVVHHRR